MATEIPLTPQQQRIVDKTERKILRLAKENDRLIKRILASRARRGAG